MKDFNAFELAYKAAVNGLVGNVPHGTAFLYMGDGSVELWEGGELVASVCELSFPDRAEALRAGYVDKWCRD